MTIGTKNITCPHCRYRHPADRSCALAADMAEQARAEREQVERDIKALALIGDRQQFEDFVKSTPFFGDYQDVDLERDEADGGYFDAAVHAAWLGFKFASEGAV